MKMCVLQFLNINWAFDLNRIIANNFAFEKEYNLKLLHDLCFPPEHALPVAVRTVGITCIYETSSFTVSILRNELLTK